MATFATPLLVDQEVETLDGFTVVIKSITRKEEGYAVLVHILSAPHPYKQMEGGYQRWGHLSEDGFIKSKISHINGQEFPSKPTLQEEFFARQY